MGVVAEEKKRMKAQKDLRRLRDDKLICNDFCQEKN